MVMTIVETFEIGENRLCLTWDEYKGKSGGSNYRSNWKPLAKHLRGICGIFCNVNSGNSCSGNGTCTAKISVILRNLILAELYALCTFETMLKPGP
jgi:hypothetical protein